MESKLSVEIGAQLTNLNTEFAKAVGTVTAGTQAMNSQIGKTEKQFTLLNNTKFTFGANYATASSKLATEAQRTSAILGGSFKKGANEAGFALTNLGRVAQDAPFGFIGIQNNLNPLLESFQRLKAETGSAGSALKALGSSLVGPAGLGIALSVVSAAILFYQQYQQKAKKSTEEAVDVNKEFVSSLDQISQAQLKGSQNAVAELTTLKLLYSQTQDITLSLKQRTDAVDQLQEKYPDYFKNVKDEVILAGNAKDAYIALSQAILATARSRAAEELIGENTKQQLINERRIADLKKEGLTVARELRKEKQIEDAIRAAGGSEGQGALNIENRRNEISKEIAKNKIANRALDSQNLDLIKSVNIEIEKGAKLTGSVGKSGGGIGKASEDINKLRKELQELKEGNYISGLELLQKSFEQLGSAAKGLNKGKLNSEPLISMDSILPKNMAKLVAQELELINFELIKFNNDASDIINSNLVGTFSGIGDAIGDALAGGQNILTGLSMTLLGSLGSVITDLGRLAIATGVGIKAIKTAFKTLNPLVAIAAGVGLVALGSAITKSVSRLGEKMPGYANGTNSAAGGLALVGERGPEIVNLPTGSAVTPNHQIAGMMGGGNVFIPDMVLRGEDIWVSFRKVNKRLTGLG